MIRSKDPVSVTPSAAARIAELLDAGPDGMTAVKLSVAKGGCAGMSYGLELVEAVSPGDVGVATPGGPLVVDGNSLLFLLGTTLDFWREGLSSQFVFENPNQLSACGCGESVSLKPCQA